LLLESKKRFNTKHTKNTKEKTKTNFFVLFVCFVVQAFPVNETT